MYSLLGQALWLAQRIEYGLYGLAAHMPHLPEAKKDKRFANLTPDDFLSPDPAKKKLRKATLGQIYDLFGDRLNLSGKEFDQFVAHRNLIVHDFWRETNPGRGGISIPNPEQFLREFLNRAIRLDSAIQGLYAYSIEAAAEKEGRLDELKTTERDTKNKQEYASLVASNLIQHLTLPSPPSKPD